MKLLVTGGTGLIGSRLACAAKSAGIDVTVTGQVNTPAELARRERLEVAGIPVRIGSLQEESFCRDVVAGRSAVVHLAAAQHESNVPDSYFFEINQQGTAHLLEACRVMGVRRFVYGSTIGVYGAVRNGELSEDSPPNPSNAYGRSKLAAEKVVRSFAHLLETVIVRISETYGPGDLRLLKLFRALEHGRFFILGSGLNRRQIIHVDDVCRGLLLAAQHPSAVSETVILAGREILTTRDFVATIATALGRDPPRLRLPLWPFQLAAFALETALRPFGIAPPLHHRRLDFFCKSFLFSTRHAQEKLGFEARIGLLEGAQGTAAWYRNNGYLEGGNLILSEQQHPRSSS